jgi:hypothetical protein
MRPRVVSTIAWITILTALVISLLSCSSKPSQELAGGAAGKGPAQSTAQAPEAKPAEGGKGGWLEGIPDVVPPFTYGTFNSTESRKNDFGNQTMYTLYYNGVSLENAREYLGKLKANGFRVEEETAREGEIAASGELRQGKGKIGFSLGRQKSGHVDFTINVVKKYE